MSRFYLFRGLGLTWLYVPFQWFYLREQGLSATSLMALNTLFCVAAVLFEVPTGALADRLGRRAVLVAGSLSSAISSVLFFALTQSMAALAAANILAALAMTCISGADSAYLFELLRWEGRLERYRRAESISTAIRLLAAAIGGLSASAMIARGLDLSALYVVTALLTGSAALLAMTLPEPWREQGEARERRRRPLEAGAGAVIGEAVAHARRAFSLVGQKRSLVCLMVLSAVLFPVLRVGLFLDQPFAQRLGFSTASLGLVFAAKDLVAAAAAAVTAALVMRLGELRLLTALPIAVCLALALMAVADGHFAVSLVLLPTAAFGVFSPLVRVFVNRRLNGTRERATVLSIEGMARRFGFALFSPLIGAAVDLWSLEVALMISAAWAAVAVVLAASLPFRSRPRLDAQPSSARRPHGSLTEEQAA